MMPVTDTTPIVTERTIATDVSTVWRAISDGEVMPQWYFERIEAFRPEVGFETGFTVSFEGKSYVHLWRVTEAEPQRRLSYTFNYDGLDGDALVTWELVPVGDSTRVKVTHRGLHTFPQDEEAFTREACSGGWDYFLGRLKAHIEGAS